MSAVTIKFNGVFTVENIKVRVEGSKVENTQQPAIDLKLAGTVAPDILPALLCTDAETVKLFWAKSTDGRIPAFPHMRDVKTGAQFDDCMLAIEPGHRFKSVRLDQFVFRVQDEHLIDVKFRAALVGLSDESSGFLCSLFHDKIDLRVESAQMDLLDVSTNDERGGVA